MIEYYPKIDEKRSGRRCANAFLQCSQIYPGFFVLTQNEKKKEKFLEACFNIFLYAPDDIIKKFNEALVSMGYQKPSPTAADRPMQEAVLAMRRALYGDTSPKSDDILFPVPAKTSP